MKMIIALAALLAVAAAAPTTTEKQNVVEFVRNVEHNNIGTNDGYGYEYALSDGSRKQEQATYELVKDAEGHDVDAIVVRGSYSFVDANGVEYTVNYVADKDGFHPEGAHLPVAPVA